MKKRAILTSEESQARSGNPILVIDKEGLLGVELAKELEKDFVVIYAGKERIKNSTRVIHVSIKNKVLQIPDNVFSHIFLFANSKKELDELLHQLVKKAKLTNSRLSAIIKYTNNAEENINLITRNASVYPVTVYVVGEIFGKQASRLDEFIRETRKNERITLPNDGLTESYPVHVDTLVEEIIRVTFQTENTSQIFLIFQKFPITDLALARIFTKILPEIKIQFNKTKNKILKKPILSGIYTMENFNLEQKIKQEIYASGDNIKKKINVKKSNKYVSWAVKILLIIISMPLLLTLIFSLLGLTMAKSGWDDLRSGGLVPAEKKFSIAKNSFTIASETGKSVHYIMSSLGLRRHSEKMLSLLTSSVQLSEAGQLGVTAGIHYKNILTGVSKDPSTEVQKATQSMRGSLTLLQKVSSENDLPTSIKEEIINNQKLISLGNNLADLTPEILGIIESKKYLLLFQNNMELRPGGGFIGSYGILTVHNGVIKDLKINDVYDADGKLKGHVEPPFPLRRYGGVQHWYLRDSNFNIDFEENAKKAMYFLELETGEEVDGVLALDTEVLTRMLKIYGPLSLPGYNKVVNSDNIVMVTQEESQDDFFPGSTQKKDFLNTLKVELEKKIKDKKAMSYDVLISSVISLISEKHIMFVLKNDASQKVIRSSNISGSLPSIKTDNSTLDDILYINEANIGGTKGNMYLKRDVIHTVKLDGNTIREELKIRYQNTSTSSSKYGGDYVGYVQLAMPLGTSLKKISIDGSEKIILPAVTDPEIYETESFVEVDGIEVLTVNTQNFSIFSFPILVPIKTKQVVTLNYEVVKPEKNFNKYRISILKQPGIIATPYLLKIYYENGNTPLKLTGLQDKVDRGEYRGNLTTDFVASLHFKNQQ